MTSTDPLPTYTLAANFAGDYSNTRPLTSFYQFECRGPIFRMPDETQVQLFWFNALSFYIIQNDIALIGARKSNVVQNTPPDKQDAGLFQVQFQIQTADGLFHYGVWGGNWDVETSRLGFPRPLILAGSTLQIDQSTVAILN